MKAAVCALLLISSLSAADLPATAERVESMLADANGAHVQAVAKADHEYRIGIAKTLQFADVVEIFLLDHAMGNDAAYLPKEGDAVFPIRPDNKESKVLHSLKVPPKDTARWTAAIAKLVTSDKRDGGAACHFPIHGIRIYAGDTLLFETSICWLCTNYYFSYGWRAEWEPLSADGKDLQALFDEFMPIPETETARLPGFKQKAR